MTQSKHTKGPWHRNIKANGKYPVIFAGRNQHVAQAIQQKDGAETEANIDLIAAAPELLEALVELAQLPNKKRPDQVWQKARAAIAKARGQSC